VTFLETYQFQEASSETAGQYHRKRKGLPYVFCSQAPVTLDVSFIFNFTNIFFSILGNPEALLNTVWLNNTLHFGMRGRKEHVDMLFGDVKMMTTPTGEQYLEYNERLTKTTFISIWLYSVSYG
jgi:hypothetical protein